MREQNPARKPSFDAIVANPPFSLRWEPTDALADDVRLKSHVLTPKSAAAFAVLLRGFHYPKDEGVMAIQPCLLSDPTRSPLRSNPVSSPTEPCLIGNPPEPEPGAAAAFESEASKGR